MGVSSGHTKINIKYRTERFHLSHFMCGIIVRFTFFLFVTLHVFAVINIIDPFPSPR